MQQTKYSRREYKYRGAIGSHIDITREDLLKWKRRRAVILYVSFGTFKFSHRTYANVHAVNFKTLKKAKTHNYTPGKNNPGWSCIYKVLDRWTMDLMLDTPTEKFRIYLYAGAQQASASMFLTPTEHIQF